MGATVCLQAGLDPLRAVIQTHVYGQMMMRVSVSFSLP